jgi:hypothetical protein
MAAFTRTYLSLFPWLAFAPVVIATAAILMTLRISRHRWIAHVIAFVALLTALPAYLWIQGILDPTTIDYPGPGDGLVVLLYLFCLVPAILAYSGYAWLTRRKPPHLRVQSAAQG